MPAGQSTRTTSTVSRVPRPMNGSSGCRGGGPGETLGSIAAQLVQMVALPVLGASGVEIGVGLGFANRLATPIVRRSSRSEEHTSELQSLTVIAFGGVWV